MQSVLALLVLSRLFTLLRRMKMWAETQRATESLFPLSLSPELLSLSPSLCSPSPSPMFLRRPLVSLLYRAAHARHALVELAPPSRGLEAPQSPPPPASPRSPMHPSLLPLTHLSQLPSVSSYSGRSEVSPQEAEASGPAGRGK